VGGSRLKTTLLYVENGVGLNPAIGAAAGYVFNLNSLHDPNTSGVGHQPTGFDQLIAIYEQFVVYGVKYRIQVANSETSLEAIHGITITDQPGTVTDPRQYMENGQTQWKCVAARGGGNISEFSGYVDLAKVHGIKPEEYLEEDVYAGNSATSPTENAYLHVWVAPMNATSDIGDQVVYAELQYYCMFKGGKLNALS